MKKLFLLPLLCLTLLTGSWTDKKENSLLLVDGNEKVHILTSGKVDLNIFKNGFESWDILMGDQAVKIQGFNVVYAPKRGDAMSYGVHMNGRHEVPGFMEKIGAALKVGDRVVIVDITATTSDGKRNLSPLVFTFQ